MKKFTLIFCSILIISCSKDFIKEEEKSTTEVSEIDNFIWNGLSTYYLWTDVAPYLSSSAYNDINTRNNFISQFKGNHEELFNNLLYLHNKVDKWSWIVDDYEELENSFQGISKSMGFDFKLSRITKSANELIGYVRYVIPNSPAAQAGIKRGDLFLNIDNHPLTINNYRNLIYNDNFKISFAKKTDDGYILNGLEKDLSAIELTENPIHIVKTFDINGSKIGYLMYNSFTRGFDNALNNTFLKLKNQGVKTLILDLRYNGGGSIQTATYLGSMIYGTEKKLFSKSVYNDFLNKIFTQKYGKNFGSNYFKSTILENETPINTLNLTSLYVLCSKNTASASELIINCLRPYMNVKLIGTNTHGKYVGSFTVKDKDNDGNLNPNHKWAMQPITLKISNAQGISDYVDGFTPDIFFEENINNMGVLGNENEPMLKVALDNIKGKHTTTQRNNTFDHDDIAGNNDQKPFAYDMYFNQITLELNDIKKYTNK